MHGYGMCSIMNKREFFQGLKKCAGHAPKGVFTNGKKEF